jgi:hypothetical protein
MVMLELVSHEPDWMGALEVALTRPTGVPERRAGDDPWTPSTNRPRRISDDLAWLRQAIEEPEQHGLRAVPDSAAVAAWEVADGESSQRFARLAQRGVLDAAGFLVHDPDDLRAALAE